MKTNFFGDFEYYAEINGQLFELEHDYRFDREVKIHKSSNCMLGMDFVHVGNEPNIKPCIKIDLNTGSHLIKLTSHHVRPFKGISYLTLKDEDGNILLENKILPEEILKYNIKIKRNSDFNLYLTFSSTEVHHGLIRVLLETEPTKFDEDIDIKLEKTTWKIREIDLVPIQEVEIIEYDTEYKY